MSQAIPEFNDLMDHAIKAAVDEKRWDDARHLVAEAIASMPNDWRPIRNLKPGIAGACWDQEEFEAFVHYRRPSTEGPILWTSWSYSKLWWKFAIINRKQGRHENALLCIEKGLELEPDHPYLWMQRGLILSEIKRFGEALVAYQTAAVIRTWAPKSVVAWALRSQGYTLIELGRLTEAQTVYRRSLDMDPGNDGAENELDYIEHLLREQGAPSKTLPWFLNCLRFPPEDQLTRQLVAVVAGLEPIPGPKTIGADSYGRISRAFLTRGWAGFDEAFNQIFPRERSDYVELKRNLLREPIFLRPVHERMARIYLGKATIDEVLDEIKGPKDQAKPQ